MSCKELERIIQLHRRDTQAISHQVREKIFTGTSSADVSTSANVSVIPYTCRGNSVGSPLRLPNSILSPHSTLAEHYLAYVVEVMLYRASKGSVALNVLEHCFSDSRRGQRSVYIRAYAEYIDLHRTGVFDRNGCQWPLFPAIDRFDLACKGWKFLTSVADEPVNTSVRLAKALRGVVATTYGCVCTGKLSSSGGMLAVALENTTIAAASALAVVSACPRGLGFIQGKAFMRLPCGSILTFQARYDNDAKRVNEVLVRIDDHGRISGAVKVSVKVMSMVLSGAGVRMTADIIEEDINGALDQELADILKMQSAVQCLALHAQHGASSEQDIFDVHNLVRCLTIYRIRRTNALSGDDLDYDEAEDERVAIAREEALDTLLGDKWNIGKSGIGEYLGEYLGEDSDKRFELSTSSRSDSEDYDIDPGRGRMYRPGFGGPVQGIVRPPPLGGVSTAGPIAVPKIPFVKCSTSGAPLLSSNITTGDGIRIRAQQGVVLQPDPRGHVVIRKRSFLWGRVIFEDDGFAARPLVSGAGVLRAVIPVQSIGLPFAEFSQFESSRVQGRGSAVANLLLSGTFGADAALWALKKIIFSGRGLKPGFEPSYLIGLKSPTEAEGFGINSALGSEAVKAIEVLVKNDRVFLDAKGDFEAMEVRKVGRKFKCVPAMYDIEDACAGTIDTTACIF